MHEGAETVLLCVGGASDEGEVEQIEDVGEGRMDDEVEECDEVGENTESTDERTEEIEFWRVCRTAWTMVGSVEKEAYSMCDSAFW